MPPSARSKVPRFSAGLVGAAGAGAVAVAEELGLDEVFGDGGAVELDEDAVAAEGFGVDGAGDELFAGAGFAEDEDAAVGGGHELDLLAQGLDGDGFAGDGVARGELRWANSWFSTRSLWALMALRRTRRVRSSERGFSRKS